MAFTDSDRQVNANVQSGAYNNVADATTPIHAGDLCYWDTNALAVKSMTAATQGDSFVGVAEDSIPPVSNVDNGTAQGSAGNDLCTILHKGRFRFAVTNGETYVHGSLLVMGADARTLRLKVGGDDAADVIAFAYLPDGTTVVAGAATEIDVVIRANYPAAGILN